MCTRVPPLRRDYIDDEGFLPAARADVPNGLDLDRLCRAYKPDSAYYEFRDGSVFRIALSTSGEWVTTRLIQSEFIVLGKYPPEGHAFEWGIRVLLNGVEHKLPSRLSVNAQGLSDFFEEHGATYNAANCRYIAEAFDWSI